MANAQKTPLLTLSPFAAIDTTSVPVDLPAGTGVSGVCANPYRVTGALTAERGRTNLVNITVGGTGSELVVAVPYVPSPALVQFEVVTLKGSAYSRALYDPSTGGQTLLEFGDTTDATYFNQAVQYGNVIYDNAGRQYSSANPENTYLWQYPAPDGDAQAYAVTAGAGGLPAGTYSYAFTQVVTPGASPTPQETTATGADVDVDTNTYPYSVTLAAAGSVSISGTFAGTNADGSTYTTNVYRLSLNQPVWYLLVNLDANTPYTDTTADALIAADAQLIEYRDPPPLSPTDLGAICNHKELMWAFVVQQNADTGNVPQTQLWYSNLGRPWEFDGVNNVMLVGNSATPNDVNDNYTGIYGDIPVGLVSLSSLLLAFKTRSTWAVYGDDPTTFLVRKLLDIGCRARQSVAVGALDSTIVSFFLSEDGVCICDGYSFQYISEPIRSVIEGLSLSDRENAVGMFNNHAYYISFPELGQTWAFYTSTQKWFGPLPYATPFAVTQRADPAAWNLPTAIGAVYAVRQDTNDIDQWFSAGDVDLGAPQAVAWTGPLTDSGLPGSRKDYTEIALLAPLQPGVTATVTLTLDPGTTNADGSPKQYSWPFDLGTNTAQVVTVPQDLSGFIAQLSVAFSTLVDNDNAPVQIWRVVAVGDVNSSYIPYDTTT